MKKISILLADDHRVVREGLRVLVETEGDIQVVGEPKTGREAIDMTLQLHPHVVVMDIAMPLLNGLQATREILRIAPATKVLILSAHADPDYVEQVVLLGAAGYLVKQSSADILVEAIRAVHKGKSFFSPSISKYLREHYQNTPYTAILLKRKSACLTSREEGVLQLIAEGNANKQIASELGISIKTVEKHRQHLMQKLSIHDIAGLTRYAIAAGVIESNVQRTTNAPESDKGGANTAGGQRARVSSYRGQRPPSEFELIKNRVLEGVLIKGSVPSVSQASDRARGSSFVRNSNRSLSLAVTSPEDAASCDDISGHLSKTTRNGPDH